MKSSRGTLQRCVSTTTARQHGNVLLTWGVSTTHCLGQWGGGGSTTSILYYVQSMILTANPEVRPNSSSLVVAKRGKHPTILCWMALRLSCPPAVHTGTRCGGFGRDPGRYHSGPGGGQRCGSHWGDAQQRRRRQSTFAKWTKAGKWCVGMFAANQNLRGWKAKAEAHHDEEVHVGHGWKEPTPRRIKTHPTNITPHSVQHTYITHMHNHTTSDTSETAQKRNA